jgi:hypothetical protein
MATTGNVCRAIPEKGCDAREMETSLHQQLKLEYAGGGRQTEVRIEGFRIDAVRGSELVEIQLGSLAAIRAKVARLLAAHRVVVVKPLIVRKTICKRSSRRSAWSRGRLSPKRESWLDLIHQLVYFCEVFPHPRLTIEVPFLEITELRLEHRPQRRRRRWKGYTVEDQQLVEVLGRQSLSRLEDLRSFVPQPLPELFHSGHIAQVAGVDRWVAQRVAYCWRKTGLASEVGRQGNTRLYRFAARDTKALREGA